MYIFFELTIGAQSTIVSSVADPDPYVFEPPGSGSESF
jgi:hypothetical protein